MLRGGKKFISAEGNTQDDLLATYAYTLSLQPLICRVQVVSQAKECWFADDATRCGPLQNVRVWWDELTIAGTDLGYYPNAGKCRRSLIRKRLPGAFLKKQQSTSPQKERSIRVQPLAPRPTLSTTSTVERGTVHHRSQLYTSWTWAAGAASENRRHMLLNPSQVAVL